MGRVRFSADLASATEVRRFVAQELRREAIGEEAVFRAQLLATELVTNAIRHAGSGVELTVGSNEGRIRIEVRDGSPAKPVPPEVDAHTRHRGLLLVEDLSERWGVDVHDHDGKVVWCEVRTG